MQEQQIMLAMLLALGVFLIAGLLVVPAIKEANAGCENGNLGTVNNTILKSRGKCLDRGTF